MSAWPCGGRADWWSLPSGSGRVAIPVAQATGKPVIGIDSSPAMLAKARAGAAKAGVRLDLREGDMRDLALDEPAGLIYCPYRTLLHLRTWRDRRRTFERVAASLRPDGRFAWNAFAFDRHVGARIDGGHQDKPVPHSVRFWVGDNRIDLTLDDGGTSSLWWATKNEWLGLLDVAGLEVAALYGGFAGEPFTDESHEYVFVARHRGATGTVTWRPVRGRVRGVSGPCQGRRRRWSHEKFSDRSLRAAEGVWGQDRARRHRSRCSGGHGLFPVGPNGAGKTTTVNVLTTLMKADGGTVRVAGHDVATEARAVRAVIGVTGRSRRWTIC